ncbi:uncharacterized protein LOC142570786 [Dermacentor variabilis]|uniref:uncharacterized protein LOC142570786 n=1 Tax=Dermacentor variabilis TaxID=34621 RepID=UPI003F5C7733
MSICSLRELDPFSWKQTVTHLDLTIDHRLTWISAAKALSAKVRRVHAAVRRLLQRGRGCSTKWALRLNKAAATSSLLYALPLVSLTHARKAQLEVLHRTAIRNVLGLPRHSKIAATLAEAGEWPLSLLMLQRGLGHIDRLHRAPDGQALLDRLRSLPASRMGNLCRLYEETVPQLPVAVTLPPPHHGPPDVHLSLKGEVHIRRAQVESTSRSPAAGGSLQAPGGVGRTPAGVHEWFSPPQRVGSSASSTAAELAGLHLAADLLAEHLPQQPVAVVCETKPALQALVKPRRAGLAVVLLLAKLTALATAGIPISFHWLPSHVGVAGNEEADTYAKAAHHDAVPVTRAVAASDYTRHRLQCLLTSIQPDTRVASGRAPKPLPENGLTRRDRSTLLRLWTGCTWTAARLYAKGRSTSPACKRCGDPETLEHLLCACPSLAQERSTVMNTYRRQGLPAATETDLLFPVCPQLPALRSLLEFISSTGRDTL